MTTAATGAPAVRHHRIGAAIDVVDIVARRTGPRLALIAGVHGDEPEGPLAVMRLIEALPTLLVRGSVRAVAVANPLAFDAEQRETPDDGVNLARAFPGRPGGTPTERLAAALHEEVIAGADFVVDLHSAGRDYAMPLFCGFRVAGGPPDAESEAAARAFGAPLVWRHTGALPHGRTMSSAAELGIPSLYAEAEGGGEVRGRSLDLFVSGVLRVAHRLGLVATPPPAPSTIPLLVDGGSGDIDRSLPAPADGYLVTRCAAGDVVEAGATLAELLDERARTQAIITAPTAGTVMLLRRRARIRRGAKVALVAGVPAAWRQP